MLNTERQLRAGEESLLCFISSRVSLATQFYNLSLAKMFSFQFQQLW